MSPILVGKTSMIAIQQPCGTELQHMLACLALITGLRQDTSCCWCCMCIALHPMCMHGLEDTSEMQCMYH